MRDYKYKINSKILVPYPDSDNLTDKTYAVDFRIVGYGVNPHTYIIYDNISNKKRAVYLGPKYDRWFKNRIMRAVDLSDIDGRVDNEYINEELKKELKINGKRIIYEFEEDRKKKPAKKSAKRKPKKVVKKCKCN